MSCYLAIEDKEETFKHYKVPREVYVYVRQLEIKLKLLEKKND